MSNVQHRLGASYTWGSMAPTRPDSLIFHMAPGVCHTVIPTQTTHWRGLRSHAKDRPHYFIPVGLWHLMCLSFFICKIGTIIVPPSRYLQDVE